MLGVELGKRWERAAMAALVPWRGVCCSGSGLDSWRSVRRRSLVARCSVIRRSGDDAVGASQLSSGARLDASPGGEVRAGCAVAVGAVTLAAAVAAFPQHAAAAAEVAAGDAWWGLVASEPKNALSLPTWVIHVASVAEWITAMALVWRYGDTPGNSTWKGLSWGMVPLLGGAMCACTWHFFYNAQSLEILVVLQAALTVIGNATMWVAAFRIYQSSQKPSKSS